MKSSNKFTLWMISELFFIFSVISAVMFGVFSDSVAKSMHISSAQLGWLSGIFFIAYALTQFYSGRLFVVFSAKHVLLCSTLLSAVGALSFSYASSIVLMFMSRILLGIGLASTFVGVLYVIQTNFSASSFPMMSSLSQSIANLCAGIFGFSANMLVAKYDYHLPFRALGLIFLICTTMLLLFFKNDPLKTKPASLAAISFAENIKTLVKNPQIWFASIYFAGLFGAILTFADLFNVAFQVAAFHISYSSATIINSMIPFGLTCGGLLAGYWAQKSQNFVAPARVFSFLAILMFSLIIFVKFNSQYSVAIIAAISFMFGLGCSGSILAFQLVQNSVKSVVLRPLATSFVLTFSYVFSGMLEQPIVGSIIGNFKGTIIAANASAASNSLLYSSSIHDGWFKYNQGLYCILATICLSFLASLMFSTKSTSC